MRRIAAGRCGYDSARHSWERVRARFNGDRGRWTKQPQRHCGFAPGSWTGRVAPAPAATAIAGAGQSSRSGSAGSHPEVGRAKSRPLQQRSRRWSKQPQRHCGFAPGSWTGRNGDGDHQGRHGTFSAAPRERESFATQLGCSGPWHQTLAAHSLQLIRQSQLGAGIEPASPSG